MSEEAGHPPAPWVLAGPFLATISAVPLERARPFVPDHVELQPVAPGLTVGGIVLALYADGSTLRYAELVVIPALVRFGRRPAAFVSHIVVDDERSVAGGRQIWELPKEMAEFSWKVERGRAVVEVRQGGRRLVAAGFGVPRVRAPLPAFVPVLGAVGPVRAWTLGRGLLRAGATAAAIDVPADSPFASLVLDRPAFALAGRARMTLPPPAVAAIS